MASALDDLWSVLWVDASGPTTLEVAHIGPLEAVLRTATAAGRTFEATSLGEVRALPGRIPGAHRCSRHEAPDLEVLSHDRRTSPSDPVATADRVSG